MTREPIGEIKCPWCARAAELHRSEDRPKLNPEGAAPKPSYPKKLFVICPPTTGYRGCGTTLANSAQAQERMLENGHVFGPNGKHSKPAAPAARVEQSAPTAPAPASKPAPAPQKKSLFMW